MYHRFAVCFLKLPEKLLFAIANGCFWFLLHITVSFKLKIIIFNLKQCIDTLSYALHKIQGNFLLTFEKSECRTLQQVPARRDLKMFRNVTVLPVKFLNILRSGLAGTCCGGVCFGENGTETLCVGIRSRT